MTTRTRPKSNPLIPREHLATFLLLTFCFAAWGLANNMTDPLVRVFGRIFTMTAVQSSLVQFSFYGAYFCLALPAAILVKKFSYKTGILVGLGMFSLGAFLFLPASHIREFGPFLIAIFVLAGGLSILETSCNPCILSLGSEETATRRLNLAQSFNPVGSLVGTILAGFLILPMVHPAGDAERKEMPIEQLQAIQDQELAAVMGPYVGVAIGLVLLWVLIACKRMPPSRDAGEQLQLGATLRRLSGNRHYVFGVVAQFFYVAAQICVWTFTIHYIVGVVEAGQGDSLVWFLEATGLSGFLEFLRLTQPGSEMTPETVAGMFHILALLSFLLSRFFFTAVMLVIPANLLLTICAIVAALLALGCVFLSGLLGVLCLIAISANMSLMFPTIYGIALRGLGGDLKIGGAGLVMAILGGALLPLVQGALVDARGPAFSYLVPFFCFLVVAAYGALDLRRGPTPSPSALPT